MDKFRLSKIVFIDQKRINAYEHTVKLAPVTVSSKSSQGKEQEEGSNSGEIESNIFEVNTRAVSRGQNELIGKFKMVAGDVNSVGVGYEVHVHFNRN
jgi:hypothetical protein